jgi:hypothetical protein
MADRPVSYAEYTQSGAAMGLGCRKRISRFIQAPPSVPHSRADGDVRLLLVLTADSATDDGFDACIADNARAEVRRRRLRPRSPRPISVLQ